jgi:alpha-N-arabinofuranosidase
MAQHAQGQVLDLRVDAPTLATTRHGEVSVLDSVATYDADEGRVAVFVVNRDPAQPVQFSTDLRGFGAATLTEATLMGDDDLFAVNTMQEPDRVTPKAHPSATVDGTTLRAELPPASWSMFLVQVA